MQSLSPGLALPMAAALLQYPQFQELLKIVKPQDIGIAYVVAQLAIQVTYILSMWVTSKMFVHRDAATLKNAFVVWALTFLLIFVTVFLAVIILPVVASPDDNLRMIIVLSGFGLLSLTMTFLIPMKVYVIGFLRAFCFRLLSVVINGLVVIGLIFAAVKSFGLEKNLAPLQSAMAEIKRVAESSGAPSVAVDPTIEIDRLLNEGLHPAGTRPPLAEREATVRLLQQKLQAEKDSLPPGNERAAAVFQNEFNRYLLLLNEVKAERSAHDAVSAH